MSKHITIVYGGDNSEREVSFASGKEVGKVLVKSGYKVSYLDPKNGNFIELVKALNPDIVFNALHGSFGEDGTLPAILGNLGIAYTHSAVKASAIAWDKNLTKIIAKSLGMDLPKSEVFTVGLEPSLEMELITKKPFVIKPVSDGSSCNIQIILKPGEFRLTDLAKLSAGKYLIEEYIGGREISIAVLDDKVMGAIEIITREGFYDYKAKYEEPDNQYITPPDLKKELLDDVYTKIEKLHKMLGCINISRSDFVFKDEKFYFLELNTHPGLTASSLVPKIASGQGISMTDLVIKLVEN
jgi:D-alanine-D-alanine ligase